MRIWQLYHVLRHNVNTIWKKWLTHFCIYREIDGSNGCEQSWWMKGICLIWSRGRHFSPSLPDRGPTQGRGPTGIWNFAHSISDPRAEISGILVIVRRSSATSRGTTYWFLCFLVSCAFRLRMRNFSKLLFLYHQEKNRGNNMLDPRFLATFPLTEDWIALVTSTAQF